MAGTVEEGQDVAVAVIFHDIKGRIELLEAPDATHIEAQEAKEEAAQGRTVRDDENAVAVLMLRKDVAGPFQDAVPDLAERFATASRERPVRGIDSFQFARPFGRNLFIRMAFPFAKVGFLQRFIGDDRQAVRRRYAFRRGHGPLEGTAVYGIEVGMAEKSPRHLACSSPWALMGTSVEPWYHCCTFPSVSP